MGAGGTGPRRRASRRSRSPLGLDFFVGATVLNLTLNYTWAAVATTALTILVRKLLTFSLRVAYGP